MAALARETAGGVTVRAKFPRKLDFLLGKKARFKVVHGGRGGAKSWAIARALLIRGVNEPGLRVLCTRQVQSSMKESVHQLLKDQIELLGLGAKYRVLDDQIRGPGGTLFTFKGLSDPDALKSTEGVDVTSIIIESGDIPSCAMQVTREGVTGVISSFAPEQPCGCFFENAATGQTSCASCRVDADCGATSPKCRFDYCEAY